MALQEDAEIANLPKWLDLRRVTQERQRQWLNLFPNQTSARSILGPGSSGKSKSHAAKQLLISPTRLRQRPDSRAGHGYEADQWQRGCRSKNFASSSPR